MDQSRTFQQNWAKKGEQSNNIQAKVWIKPTSAVAEQELETQIVTKLRNQIVTKLTN